MGDGYFADGFWKDGYFAAGYWGGSGTAVAAPSIGTSTIFLKRPKGISRRRLLELIQQYLTMKQERD